MIHLRQITVYTALSVLLTLTQSGCSSGGSGSTEPASPSVGTAPPPPLPSELIIHDAEGLEGDDGVTTLNFTVELNKNAATEVTASYSTSDLGASSIDDYTAVNGTFSIPPGETVGLIAVDVQSDTRYEADEQFSIAIFDVSDNVVVVDDEAFGNIINDDLPEISLEPRYFNEANAAAEKLVFDVHLEAALTEAVSVDFTVSTATATAGLDFQAASGTITFAPGETSKSIPVTIINDTEVENSEAVLLELSNPQGLVVLKNESVHGIILDDDSNSTAIQLICIPASAVEGDDANTELTFSFVLDRPAADDISVDFVTIDDTANSLDYQASSGSLLIPAGELETFVNITILGDSEQESLERFYLELSNAPMDVDIVTSPVAGLIIDNDTEVVIPPSMEIQSTSLDEGDSGEQEMIFVVSLSEPASEIISVDFATEAVTATEAVDFAAQDGTLVFLPGITSLEIFVIVFGDEFTENDETFRVRLSNLTGNAVLNQSLATGTIQTDDPIVRLSIDGTSILEGDGDPNEVTFSLYLDVAPVNMVTVDFSTEDGSAIAGEDYTGQSGQLSFAPGVTEATISVQVLGDTISEVDENFSVILSNLSPNATFNSSSALGTLINDDGTPGWQGPTPLGDVYGPERPSLDLAASGYGAVLWLAPLNPQTFRYPVNVRRFESSTWQDVEALTEINSSPFTTLNISAPDNQQLVGFWQSSTDDSGIYDPSSGWQLQTVDTSPGWDQDMDKNQNGYVIVSWHETSGPNETSAALFNPASSTWEPPITLDAVASTKPGIPKVGIDPHGNAIAVWPQVTADGLSFQLYFTYFDTDASAWSVPDAIPNSSNLHVSVYDVGMTSAGEAIVISRDDTGFRTIRAHHYTPATNSWAESDPAAGASEGTFFPVLSIDGQDNAFLLWAQLQPGQSATYDIYAGRYDSQTGTWSAPALLENLEETIRFDYDIATDNAGNAIAIWEQDGPAITPLSRIRVAHFNAAHGQWDPAEQLHDDVINQFNNSPSIAMDAFGNAMAIWIMETDSGDQLQSNRFISQ